MRDIIKFRQYKTLPINIKPIIEGQSADIIIKRQKGCVRVMANSAIRNDGLFNVSLWNRKTDKYFSKLMTKSQLTKAIRNDGVELVWVRDNFKYGEICEL